MNVGIDVWHGYGRIDWASAKAAGVSFAWLKCTQGNDGKDPRFDEYAAGAKAAGVAIGAYLFGYPLPGQTYGRSPVDQAHILYADSQGLGKGTGDLPPALDLEWPVRGDWSKWGVDAEFIADWSLACLEEMTRLWGRKPLVYTYPDFWHQLGDAGRQAAWAQYPLWIATYVPKGSRQWTPADDEHPLVPAPWTDWAVWQFSAEGSPIVVPGVQAKPLDRNVCRDLDALVLQRPVDSIVLGPVTPHG